MEVVRVSRVEFKVGEHEGTEVVATRISGGWNESCQIEYLLGLLIRIDKEFVKSTTHPLSLALSVGSNSKRLNSHVKIQNSEIESVIKKFKSLHSINSHPSIA